MKTEIRPHSFQGPKTEVNGTNHYKIPFCSEGKKSQTEHCATKKQSRLRLLTYTTIMMERIKIPREHV